MVIAIFTGAGSFWKTLGRVLNRFVQIGEEQERARIERETKGMTPAQKKEWLREDQDQKNW